MPDEHFMQWCHCQQVHAESLPAGPTFPGLHLQLPPSLVSRGSEAKDVAGKFPQDKFYCNLHIGFPQGSNNNPQIS